MDIITIQKGSRSIHGEMTVQEAYGVPCRVTEINRTRKAKDGSAWPQYDLEVFLEPRDVRGVLPLVYDDVEFIYDGRKYVMGKVEGVKDFDGTLAHYQLMLKAV